MLYFSLNFSRFIIIYQVITLYARLFRYPVTNRSHSRVYAWIFCHCTAKSPWNDTHQYIICHQRPARITLARIFASLLKASTNHAISYFSKILIRISTSLLINNRDNSSSQSSPWFGIALCRTENKWKISGFNIEIWLTWVSPHPDTRQFVLSGICSDCAGKFTGFFDADIMIFDSRFNNEKS